MDDTLAYRDRDQPISHADRAVVRRQEPPAELAGDVIGFTFYREHGCGQIRQVETASLVVPLIVSFGEPFEIALGREPGAADRVPSFAAGLYGGPVVINSFGRAECLQVDFTPLGAYRFFGFALSEIAGRMVPVADLMDRELAELARRLEDAEDWQRRFDIAERFVAGRLAGGRPPSQQVRRAYAALARSGGTARVGALARGVEWSRKHLVGRFREEVGLGPKSVARIMRFGRARHCALASAGTDWADVAAACGYADQAHLIREFRELAGDTPAKWLAARNG